MLPRGESQGNNSISISQRFRVDGSPQRDVGFFRALYHAGESDDSSDSMGVVVEAAGTSNEKS